MKTEVGVGAHDTKAEEGVDDIEHVAPSTTFEKRRNLMSTGGGMAPLDLIYIVDSSCLPSKRRLGVQRDLSRRVDLVQADLFLINEEIEIMIMRRIRCSNKVI